MQLSIFDAIAAVSLLALLGCGMDPEQQAKTIKECKRNGLNYIVIQNMLTYDVIVKCVPPAPEN